MEQFPRPSQLRVTGTYRSLWTVTAAVLLASGVLTAVMTVPASALVGLFLAVAIMTGGSAWAWASVNLAPTRWAVKAFFWSGTWAVGTVGLASLMGGWGLAVAICVGLGSPLLVERTLLSLEGRTRTPSSPALEEAGDPAPALVAWDLKFDDPHAVRVLDPTCPVTTVPPVSALSTADLGRLWKISGRWLRSGVAGSDLLHLVGVRSDCLDELERRDPEALHRWLASRQASTHGSPG